MADEYYAVCVTPRRFVLSKTIKIWLPFRRGDCLNAVELIVKENFNLKLQTRKTGQDKQIFTRERLRYLLSDSIKRTEYA